MPGNASFSNIQDGVLNFFVAVNSSSGVADTVAPTAVVDAGAAFTNAQNVTVNMTFSEICEHDGGFVCTNSSFCELWVFGLAAVIPSTLKELQKIGQYLRWTCGQQFQAPR